MWNTETFHPSSQEVDMDKTIKILKQTIISNDVAKVGSKHTLPPHLADMHVASGNAEYVQNDSTNRAVGLDSSDSEPKKRKKKR